MENNNINTQETYIGNPRYELRFDFSVNTVDAYIEVLPTRLFTLYGHGTCGLYDKEAGDFVWKDKRLVFECQLDEYDPEPEVWTVEDKSVPLGVDWREIISEAEDYLLRTFYLKDLKDEFIDNADIDITDIYDNYGFLVVWQVKRRIPVADPDLLNHIVFYE